MKLPKLTVLSIICLFTLIVLNSCEPRAELKRTTNFEKQGIILSGAQETPAVPSTAIGTMNVFYSKNTRTLTYSVQWSGLTGAVTAMHIHGVAPTGYPSGVVQNISTSAITRCAASSTTACGSYSGSFHADGVVVKENDLLNGAYYVNIHTAAYPGGEIRGQIIFQ